AEPRFREALRVWQAAGDRPGVAFVTSALGRLATRAGRPHEAHALLQGAQAVLEHVGARGDVAAPPARVAQCRALDRPPAAARAPVEASLDAASRRQAQYELGVTLDALARAPELVGSAAAAAYGREADPILSRLGVVKLPAPAGWSAAGPQPSPMRGSIEKG